MKEVIVYKRVDELKGNPKNPRFNENAVDKVALSIQRYGFRNPLIIDENNIVWCGNTRLKAAKKLELEEVPCIVVKDLTPKQMEEYALLDNKTNEIAEWDFDLLSEILPDLDLEDFGIDWNIPELQEEIERKDLSDNIKEKFELVIKVENEMSLEELYNEMVERGYECKISTL
jgi:site-specific DNA-methyltransferase (adenine-specific)